MSGGTRSPDVRRGLLTIFGGFLVVAGCLFTLFALFFERGYRLTLTASPDGKIGGTYETENLFGKTSVEVPAGSVRSAWAEVEQRTSSTTTRTTDTTLLGGSSTRREERSIEEVAVLKFDWDMKPTSFDRPDAQGLAKRIRELPSAPPGSRVVVEREYSLIVLLFTTGMIVAGAVMILLGRVASSAGGSGAASSPAPQGSSPDPPQRG